MDLTKLFNLSHLFEVYPGPFKWMTVFVIFFSALIAASVGLEGWIKKHPERQSLRSTLPNLSTKLRWLGIIGLILLGFRYETIPYFSIRFFLLVYLIYVFGVIGNAIYRYKKIFPNTIQQKEMAKKRKRYLPKKKK